MGLWTLPFPLAHSPYHWHTRKLGKLEPLGAELMFPLTRGWRDGPSLGLEEGCSSGLRSPSLHRPQEAPFPCVGFTEAPQFQAPRGGLFGWLVSWKVRGVWAQPAQPLSAEGARGRAFSPSVTHRSPLRGWSWDVQWSQVWGASHLLIWTGWETLNPLSCLSS